MKIGDKVYCKKDKIYADEILNTKHKMYRILSITSHVLYVESETHNYSAFRIDSEDNKRFFLFNDYFYTEQELRKLKLEKLKNAI